MEIFKNPTFWTLLIAICSLIYSFVNMYIGKQVANKIMNNDLKHVEADIKLLKDESKEYKGELKVELNRIFRRLGKIDKNQARRDAVCDIRHKNDK